LGKTALPTTSISTSTMDHQRSPDDSAEPEQTNICNPHQQSIQASTIFYGPNASLQTSEIFISLRPCQIEHTAN
jgi:hypothetical protein